MMLCRLSLKNIRKSIKDYAIYFFTLILGVAIFYVFNAIDSQTVMMNVSKSTHDIIKLMTNMLSGISVFVAFILGFLIIYASRFLIKRRNKEFGIYLTLGMSKRKISMILFIETILIGSISLIVGLVIGSLLSQLMSILVVNMFEADMTEFTFIFSKSAMIKTLIYFGIMYLLVMIFNTIQISKCKLIDLIHSAKKSEKVKIKNPVTCIIIFILASIILGYAYYKVTLGVDTIQQEKEILVIIALGCISTFLIIWSISGLILKIVKSMKKVYYKGLNSFTLRQISSKINTTVFSMSIICIMLFITICVLSSSLSIKNSLTANLNQLAPVDIELSKLKNISIETAEEEYGYSKEKAQDSYKTIEETLETLNFNTNQYLKDITTVNLYATEDLMFKDTLGNSFNSINKKYPFLRYNMQEQIVKLTDYNKIAQLYGKETYSLNDNEYLIIANYDSMVEVRNEALKINTTIKLNNKIYSPKYKKCKNSFIQIGGNPTNTGIIIVPDKALENNIPTKEIMLANYKASSKEEKQKIDEKILNLEKEKVTKDIFLYLNTKIDITESSIGLGALVTFIGLYLGIIFLISSAAILALKELSESADNKERYKILRRLGADESMLNKALFTQIAIFFLFPLILAIIHSIFGIKFATYILEVFGQEKLLASVTMTAVFLIVIYGGYFLITYICSKNIIKEK